MHFSKTYLLSTHQRPDPVTDPSRLAALAQTELLDSEAERSFDRLTELVCKLLDVPVSLVSLVDADRQFFKSAKGLAEPWATLRQTPLSHSFCQHVVGTGGTLVVADARVTPLVQDNLAIRDLGVVAYVGVPLVEPSGHAIGALCAISGQPRAWTAEEVEVLTELAALVMNEIELREHLRERREAEAALLQLNGTLEARVQARTAELTRSLDAMRRLNEELQNFAYIASHDLQEPLRKIALFASVLEGECAAQMSDENRQYLARIQQNALHMLRLLRDLLQYARITTHGQAFVPTDLNAIVSGVLQRFRFSIEGMEARVVVEPLPTLDADPVQLRQLFQNLLSNALHFRREGVAPEIRIGAVPVPSPGTGREGWRITVEDNGQGFDEKYRARILQPFEQLEQRLGESTGMGLAICQRIVERHRGTLDIESTPGVGSRFRVTLPLRQ